MWPEPRKPMITPEVRHSDGRAGLVGHHARPLTKVGLHLLENFRPIVRGSDVAGHGPGSNERHSGSADRQQIDDSQCQPTEDLLNGRSVSIA